MDAIVETKPARKIFYGWWVLLAGAGIGIFGAGSYQYGFGVFFKPISEEFGWSRAATAAAFSMSSLEGGLEGPLVGFLIDKFGPRKLMMIGVTLLSLGLLALSQINSLLTFYLVYMVLIAIGFNTGFHWSAQIAVANWFARRRGRALGLLASARGLGGSIMAPGLAWLVVQMGWRGSLVVLGLFMFAICLPLAMLVRRRPEDYGLLPDGDGSGTLHAVAAKGPRLEDKATTEEVDFTVGEALRSRAWWLLVAAFTLRSFGAGAVIVHQVPLLTDRGFDLQVAANTLGAVAVASMPGKAILGFLGDMFPKRYLLAMSFILYASSLAVLLRAQTIEEVYVFAALYGLGTGCGPVMQAIRAEYFGRRYFGTIGGLNQAIVMMGNVAGPVFAGWVFDITRSYDIALTVFAVTLLAGAVTVFYARQPKPPQRGLCSQPAS
ncbi:MAG: MFS transporter [Chloroflexi bacterium]|nr:MFS transporter [Chloroflexota bacterium]